MNERTRKRLEALDPERRARAEAAIAGTGTPEKRAEYEAIRERFADRPGPDALHASGAIGAEARDRMKDELAARPVVVVESLADVARALRVERERRGLSLADVARAAGSERGAVHKIEVGANPNPTVATLDRLARALGKRIRITLEDAPADPAA